jgi:hypothetical protein
MISKYINKLRRINLIISVCALLFIGILLTSCNNDSLGLDSNVKKILVVPDTIKITDTNHIQITIIDTTHQVVNAPGSIIPIEFIPSSIFVSLASAKDTEIFLDSIEFIGNYSIIIDTTGNDIVIKNFFFNLLRLDTPKQNKDSAGIYQIAFNALDIDYSYATTFKYLPGDPWQNSNDWSYISIVRTGHKLFTYDGSNNKTKAYLKITELPHFDINNKMYLMKLNYSAKNPDPTSFKKFEVSINFDIYYKR